MYHLLIKILLFSSLILYPFSEDCHEDNDDYPTPSPTCPPPFTVYTNVTNEFDLVPCFGKGFTVEKNSYAGIQVERTNPGYLKFSLASEKGDIISLGIDTNDKIFIDGEIYKGKLPNIKISNIFGVHFDMLRKNATDTNPKKYKIKLRVASKYGEYLWDDYYSDADFESVTKIYNYGNSRMLSINFYKS
ncbi:unnamed protein product [Meloidogyne enterolobii]|uniref:Uncharacterized protein n=2 Tax=Meloidogyne enterolobii TaxID=390850 RepID=A0A6V7XS00_MELEN|nr:unnamed protein product [Meloidogyne enterolobii]